MLRFRAFLLGHARLSLALLALAIAVKAVVPAGFMLTTGSHLMLTVTICADASGEARTMQMAIPVKQDAGAKHSKADKSQPCAFSGLGHGALGGADPVLLAAELAFILLVGLAPLRALPARELPFLRPPLRGPPSLSV
jgi:hypothetical protein